MPRLLAEENHKPAVCADIQNFRVRNFDGLNIVELFAGEPRLVMFP